MAVILDLLTVQWYCLVIQNRSHVVEASLREEYLSRRFEAEVIAVAVNHDLEIDLNLGEVVTKAA